MGASFGATTSHIGLCVRDLERSRRFYIDGLGFHEFARFEIDASDRGGRAAVWTFTSYFIQKDGLRIELLHYRWPGVIGQPSDRGGTTLAHAPVVRRRGGVDSTTAELEQYSGADGLTGTRSGQHDPDMVQIIFVADPDGTRVELMRLAKGQDW